MSFAFYLSSAFLSNHKHGCLLTLDCFDSFLVQHWIAIVAWKLRMIFVFAYKLIRRSTSACRLIKSLESNCEPLPRNQHAVSSLKVFLNAFRKILFREFIKFRISYGAIKLISETLSAHQISIISFGMKNLLLAFYWRRNTEDCYLKKR